MMAAIFATLFVALTCAWLGLRKTAAVCLLACLALAIWLFLFEIYSPDYGFRMPWLQTQGAPAVPVRGA
jgi:hypothetical protein